jgi:predicted ester cyclase
VLDELLAPDWKTNGWPEGIPQSIETAKEFYQMALQAFPDIHYVTLDLIAEGDRVVQRHMFRGTFKGELVGLAPNGEVVEAEGVSIFRIVDGKIVEHITYVNETDFWHKAGAEVPECMLTFIHRTDAPVG